MAASEVNPGHNAQLGGSALQDLIECSICLSSKTKPKQLPCQHSFCNACLTPLALNKSIKCPECRQESLLPDEGVDGLPADFSANKLKSVLSGLTVDDDGPVCTNCQSTEAQYLCKTCQEYFCEQCADSFHRKLAVFKNHELVLSEKCKKHPMKERLYACTECQEVICNLCLMSEHVKHDVVGVDKYLVDRRAELRELLHTVSAECTINITAKANRSGLEIEDIENRFSLIKSQIEISAVKNRQKIKLEETKLLKALDVDRKCFDDWLAACQEGGLIKSRVQELSMSCSPFIGTTNKGGAATLGRINGLSDQLESLMEQITESRLSSINALSIPASFSAASPNMTVGTVVYARELKLPEDGSSTQQELSLPKATRSNSAKNYKPPPEKEAHLFSVFVGNIPQDVDEDSVRTIFEAYGKVVSVRVIPVPKQGQNYGFVKFTNEGVVKNVLRQKQFVLPSGLQLKVKRYESHQKKAEQRQKSNSGGNASTTQKSSDDSDDGGDGGDPGVGSSRKPIKKAQRKAGYKKKSVGTQPPRK